MDLPGTEEIGQLSDIQPAGHPAFQGCPVTRMAGEGGQSCRSRDRPKVGDAPQLSIVVKIMLRGAQRPRAVPDAHELLVLKRLPASEG